MKIGPLPAIRTARTTIAALDAGWNEGDHPRAPNGQFGSGGNSVPAKIIDVSKKQAHDEWQESKHPRDSEGKFAETASSVGAGPAYTLKSDFVKMLKDMGFSKIKQKNAQIFVHPSGLKVVTHPPEGTLYSSKYTSFKEGSTPKSGAGIAQFKKLIGNALIKAETKQAEALSFPKEKNDNDPVAVKGVAEAWGGFTHAFVSGNAQVLQNGKSLTDVWTYPDGSWAVFEQGDVLEKGQGAAALKQFLSGPNQPVEKGAASGSAPGSVTPAASKAQAPASPAPEPALAAKEHGYSTYGYNGPDVILANGDKKVLIKPDGMWVSSTPGFPTKQVEGAKTLSMLLSGMTTAQAQQAYGSTPWVNSAMKVQTEAEALKEKSEQSDSAKKQAEQQAAQAEKEKHLKELKTYLTSQLPHPTSAEASSIASYSGSAYASINEKLRAGGKPEGHAKNIQSFLYRSTVTQEIKVYRGIGGSEGQTLLMSAVEGEAFVDRGFMSSSIRQDGSFGGVKMHITVPPGSKGAYIRSMSKHSGEDEFLLQAGSRFRIQKVDIASKTMHVTIEQAHLPAILEH